MRSSQPLIIIQSSGSTSFAQSSWHRNFGGIPGAARTTALSKAIISFIREPFSQIHGQGSRVNGDDPELNLASIDQHENHDELYYDDECAGKLRPNFLPNSSFAGLGAQTDPNVPCLKYGGFSIHGWHTK